MTPKMPQAQPETKMPDPIRIPNATDPDVIAERKKKLDKEFANRQGAASTRMVDGAASSYSRTTLG